MSKAQENVERVRVSWGSDNDGAGSTLDADLLDGLEKEALPISTATTAEIARVDAAIAAVDAAHPNGAWTFDGVTLVITGVAAP